MSEPAQAAVYLTVCLVMAVAGVLAAKSAYRNLHAAVRLRNRPLLHGIDNSRLEMASNEPWPTSGRWPGPTHHSKDFHDERRRAVYRSLAMDKALTLSLASEVALLLSAAYLGYALPRALSKVTDLLRGSSTRDRVSVSPDASVLDMAAAVWPVMATMGFVLLALVLRARSVRMRGLARMYMDPGDVAPRPTLWVPPSARDRA